MQTGPPSCPLSQSQPVPHQLLGKQRLRLGLQHFPSLTQCPLVFRGYLPREKGVVGTWSVWGQGESKGFGFVSFQRTHGAGLQREAIAED